jgi:tRNA threonylcarbamoyladenosine biosynthesis protein TsaB
MELDRFVVALAWAGRAKTTTPQPRPAPFYLRGADALPSSDPPPVILE